MKTMSMVAAKETHKKRDPVSPIETHLKIQDSDRTGQCSPIETTTSIPKNKCTLKWKDCEMKIRKSDSLSPNSRMATIRLRLSSDSS